MKDVVTVEPCDAPPVKLSRAQRDVEWFRYHVRTASGRGEADGYAPGPERNARRAALAALNALQRAEGIKPTKVVAAHDPDLCPCRACSNWRYKDKSWRASQAKKPLARSIASHCDAARAKR